MVIGLVYFIYKEGPVSFINVPKCVTQLSLLETLTIMESHVMESLNVIFSYLQDQDTVSSTSHSMTTNYCETVSSLSEQIQSNVSLSE